MPGSCAAAARPLRCASTGERGAFGRHPGLSLCLGTAPGAGPVGPRPGRRSGGAAVPSTGQATVQLEPLRLNEVGAAALPVWVAWKPMLTDALGAIDPLYETFLAVTCPDAGA